MSDQFSRLHEAFQTCDKDHDGFLNESEFLAFCEYGLGKPQSNNQMYLALCAKINCDASRGVDWGSISDMFTASNSTRGQSPPPHQQQAQAQPSTSIEETPSLSVLSPGLSFHGRSGSINSLNIDDEPRTSLPRSYSLADDDDDRSSYTSETGRGSFAGPRHERAQSSMAELELIRALKGTNEATQKKLAKKIRHLNKKLTSATNEKKQAQDEIVQLRTRVQNLEDTVGRLEREKGEVKERSRELKSERNELRDRVRAQEEQIRRLESQKDADATKIDDLENQRNEVLMLFKNAEVQFEQQMNGMKEKHRKNMEKVAMGFVESVGARPGEDVREMVGELRDERDRLTAQVETLAEQLTRKDRSLFEALQAIDALSSQQKKGSTTPGPVDAGPRRPSLLSRRFSLKNVAQYAQQKYRRNRAEVTPTTPGTPSVSTPPSHQRDYSEDSLSRQESMPSALGAVSARRANQHRPLDPQELDQNYKTVAAHGDVTSGAQ